MQLIIDFAESKEHRPPVDGTILFTAKKEIYVGLPAGTTTQWVPYSSFAVADSMEELTAMDKSSSQLYCVNNKLYRWDGTELLQIGGTDHIRPMTDEEVQALIERLKND